VTKGTQLCNIQFTPEPQRQLERESAGKLKGTRLSNAWTSCRTRAVDPRRMIESRNGHSNHPLLSLWQQNIVENGKAKYLWPAKPLGGDPARLPGTLQRMAPVEHWNNNFGQRRARFVRRTLSFPKSDEIHEICLKLFLRRYNTATIRR
jgi:hypothetical protein